MDQEQLQAEYDGLLTDIDAYTKRIEFYEKHGVRPEEDNFEYVFDFLFGAMSNDYAAPAVQLPLQEKTINVARDTIFIAKSIRQSYAVVGTRADVAQQATLILPRTAMAGLFGYRFKIRDTGSDREWQNDWVPGAALLTGNYNGLRFRTAHGLVSPGSEITIQVDAQTFGNNSALSQMDSISGQQLQIVLSGFKVPFKGGA